MPKRRAAENSETHSDYRGGKKRGRGGPTLATAASCALMVGSKKGTKRSKVGGLDDCLGFSSLEGSFLFTDPGSTLSTARRPFIFCSLAQSGHLAVLQWMKMSCIFTPGLCYQSVLVMSRLDYLTESRLLIKIGRNGCMMGSGWTEVLMALSVVSEQPML